jgi:EmrB/QacA subfamily drug resistance transporter
VWCGLAPGTLQLIVARAVQGVGAALLVPGSLALISANFSEERRGQAIGTWSGFTAIAAGIGPVLGGWLVEHFSWRWIFFINVPLAAAVLAIAWTRVPESRDEQAHGSIDWTGATLVTIGLGGIVFGLIESGTRGFGVPLVVGSLALGSLALAAFVIVEARSADPMTPLGLFRSTTFAGANLLTLLLYAALGGVLFFLPFDLIQVQGYTATAAGAALLPFVLVMFVLSPWAGSLVTRCGSRLPLVAGPLIAAAGFALFALPDADTSNYWTSFFPAVIVMSIGMTVSVAPLTTTVMGAVEERRAGVASGINNAVSRTAALLAIAVFGLVMQHVFDGTFAERLHQAPLSAELRARVLAQSRDLTNMKIPEGAGSEGRTVIEQALRESFIDGFRAVALLAALLAAAGALASWVMIRDKGGGDGCASSSKGSLRGTR